MRYGDGADLLGANDPRGASIGMIYVAPTDDRQSVLAAILTQDKLGRKQVAVVLPETNRAFQRPVDLDGLKNMRRGLKTEIVFVAPGGPGPAEWARKRRFTVFTSLESYASSLRAESAENVGAKRSLFGRKLKTTNPTLPDPIKRVPIIDYDKYAVSSSVPTPPVDERPLRIPQQTNLTLKSAPPSDKLNKSSSDIIKSPEPPRRNSSEIPVFPDQDDDLGIPRSDHQYNPASEKQIRRKGDIDDEQLIYLKPDDELTQVRELLQESQARHIILVVPQQTQFRSHVGWRLTHARARELSKDVLVISEDRQVRAVAKAGGFKVAAPLKNSVSGAPPNSIHPNRTNLGARTQSRLLDVLPTKQNSSEPEGNLPDFQEGSIYNMPTRPLADNSPNPAANEVSPQASTYEDQIVTPRSAPLLNLKGEEARGNSGSVEEQIESQLEEDIQPIQLPEQRALVFFFEDVIASPLANAIEGNVENLGNTEDIILQADASSLHEKVPTSLATEIQKQTEASFGSLEMNDLAGKLFGNYRLFSSITHGSLGDVYVAEHIELNTKAAIKVIHRHIDTEAFQNRVRRIASLMHPHILRILGFNVKDGIPFLIMDYAPNGTLSLRHPIGVLLPLTSVVNYVEQIADALQYAHDQNLPLGDIKPENMLLDDQNEIILIGFDSIFTNLTKKKSVSIGKYTAPELVSGKLLPASDQYALGAIVYEWLCGEPPISFTSSESYNEKALRLKTTLPLSLQTRIPTIPSEVMESCVSAASLRSCLTSKLFNANKSDPGLSIIVAQYSSLILLQIGEFLSQVTDDW